MPFRGCFFSSALHFGNPLGGGTKFDNLVGRCLTAHQSSFIIISIREWFTRSFEISKGIGGDQGQFSVQKKRRRAQTNISYMDSLLVGLF